jgi:hypothetical protein
MKFLTDRIFDFERYMDKKYKLLLKAPIQRLVFYK